jgi:hypothetical protein
MNNFLEHLLQAIAEDELQTEDCEPKKKALLGMLIIL